VNDRAVAALERAAAETEIFDLGWRLARRSPVFVATRELRRSKYDGDVSRQFESAPELVTLVDRVRQRNRAEERWFSTKSTKSTPRQEV
jgi:hypothetical protein